MSATWAAVLTDDELRSHVADFAPRGGFDPNCDACCEAIARCLTPSPRPPAPRSGT